MRGKLMIWIGEGGICNPEVYGCEYYLPLRNSRELRERLIAAEWEFDAFVIHFDGLDRDNLFWLANTGRTSNKYEVRMHGSSEDWHTFKSIIRHYWKNRHDWFVRWKGVK